MGREIRLVPPEWNHPVSIRPNGEEGFQPMLDLNFQDEKKGWIDGLLEWEANDKTVKEGCEYWQYYGDPPDPEYYRAWKTEEATWYQAWETVSEGTPVSPPFETQDELIEYLSENGDYWDQKRCHQPNWVKLWGGEPGVSAWGVERATAFVKSEWAPSLVVQSGQVMSGVEFVANNANE